MSCLSVLLCSPPSYKACISDHCNLPVQPDTLGLQMLNDRCHPSCITGHVRYLGCPTAVGCTRLFQRVGVWVIKLCQHKVLHTNDLLSMPQSSYPRACLN